VARQSILDSRNQVYGYELLYRAAPEDTHWSGGPTDAASARVLNDALLSVGLETLTAGRRAFINVSHQVLLADVVTLLPPEGVIIELLENIPVDDEVVEKCRALHRRGYALALDDFTPGCQAEALLPYAKFVKVDLLAVLPADLKTLSPPLLSRGLRLVAEKVETSESLELAREAGYSLFQGYFFCRPKTYTLGTMAPRRLAYLKLLGTLNKPHVTLSMVEEVIKQDASFSYRVLRSINSAAFGLHQRVRSIQEALLLLGLDRVRKWVSVWALAGINDGATPELVNITILRARCCEILGRMRSRPEAGDHFLLGLCSLLDVILGQPMEAALEELPLSTETRAALLGSENPERHILDAVTAYERGAWDAAAQAAARAGLGREKLPEAYSGALKWAWELAQGEPS
jgi:EAL and modified HD-GYP domain-containing signal transduction protein